MQCQINHIIQISFAQSLNIIQSIESLRSYRLSRYIIVKMTVCVIIRYKYSIKYPDKLINFPYSRKIIVFILRSCVLLICNRQHYNTLKTILSNIPYYVTYKRLQHILNRSCTNVSIHVYVSPCRMFT